MAERQYIGARYVPKFYVNPTDQSNDWLSGVAYEPLTIVTYLTQSYTSKIPVPATVGNPRENGEYWILTGGYNAQVEQYRREVEGYREDVEEYQSSVVDTIKAIQNDLENLEGVTCKTYQTIDEMIADFKADDVICKVINGSVQLDSTTIVPCGISYYKYKSTPSAFEYTLTNGGCAEFVVKDFKPIKGNDALDILPTILDIGYSYCGVYKESGFNTPTGVHNNVTYQSEMGPFADSISGAQGMQCSQFVNAVLRGVPYELSKLANYDYGNIENPDGAGDYLKVNGLNYYFSASQLAHFCASKGWFKETNIMDECEIGDIVFIGNTDPSEHFVTDNWKGIAHCAIVVGKGNHTIMIMQCGSTASLNASTTFGRIRRRPGYEDDGVNFDCISGVDNPFQNTDGYYGMKGFARIPLFYSGYEHSEIVEAEGNANPVAYVAGEANFNSYFIRYAAEKHAKFGLAVFGGFTSKNNNGSGFLCGASVENTVYAADGTCGGSSFSPHTKAIYPLIINKDGTTKNVQITMTIRTQGTTIGSEYQFIGNKTRVILYS